MRAANQFPMPSAPPQQYESEATNRLTLREAPEELQKQKMFAGRLYFAGVGSCANACLCKCCLDPAIAKPREARFQRATAERLAEVDVPTILATAGHEEATKIRAAIADIAQGNEDLEAVVYHSSVEADPDTIPCSCKCWKHWCAPLCCAPCGGLVLAADPC